MVVTTTIDATTQRTTFYGATGNDEYNYTIIYTHTA